MRALALSLFMKIMRMVGIKAVLKFAWRKGIYPRLKKLADESEEGWDNELLKFVNDNIYKAIDLI